ncbi:hypothetical protein F66182_5805 [Fusarium sp. NRRL 66182]|nr:hypothetical protein F66182_5805 [Fusarium sp. NRRL 66182]
MFLNRTSARALLSRRVQGVGIRRDFRTSCRVYGSETTATTPSGPAKPSGWSQQGVWAVALGAGALGWGLASFRGDNDTKGSFWDRSTASHYATLSEMEKAVKQIENETGVEGIISTDPEDLLAHGYSEWSTVNPDTLPVAVAYPRTTEQVSAIARICHENRIPIIPYSGGSSLEGNFSAPYGGVSVDFAYMDKIIQFNKDDMDIVVQPSIGWQDLNAKLLQMDSGLFFPVDPATLKLAVIPEEYSVAVVTFPTIRDAAAAAAGVMQTGIPVAAMEIMDEVQMKVINLGGATKPRIWKEEPTLFFKFSGTKEGVKDNINRVKKIAAGNKGGNFEFARDAAEQQLLWSARKESLWSMLSLRRSGDDVWSTDVAVPFSRLADIIEVSKKEMDDLGLFASILGHVGDGNFHESIMYNKEVPGERAKVEACVKNMVKRALDMDGTCTGEHSIGWGKKESLLWEVGPETLAVMAAVKKALDPRWVMNPGKIIDVPWENTAYPGADRAVTPNRVVKNLV